VGFTRLLQLSVCVPSMAACLSSRHVASANLIVAWIASVSGFQSLSSCGDFPPRRYERVLFLFFSC
jgi:hypothetical protein